MSTDGFLYDIWYVAALSRDLKPGDMVRKELLGQPVVLGRTKQGEAFALRDICPHRAAPFSAGRVLEDFEAGEGAVVECPYHGWRFRTADGVCAAIPSIATGQDFEAERIRVRRYPLRDQEGLIWIFVSADKRFQGEPDSEPPRYEPPGDARVRLEERAQFDCHVDHAVIGLMDPAHGPFVHRQWWWRSETSMHDKAKDFAPVDMGFQMVAHRPSSNSYAYKILGGAPTTEITFRLPGVRTERIRNEKNDVLGFTAVTPQNENATEIIQVFFWRSPVLSMIRPFMRPFVRAFLNQDGDMVNLQQEGLKYDPNLMLIDDADMQAKWYHQLKKEWGASRDADRPFANPVKPVTLRWRS